MAFRLAGAGEKEPWTLPLLGSRTLEARGYTRYDRCCCCCCVVVVVVVVRVTGLQGIHQGNLYRKMMNTITHPETNKSHLKMDGWKRILLGQKAYFQAQKAAMF